MSALEVFEEEKRELNALLASGIFNRAPNLALVLSYVCNKYFEGGADQIKEYSIAVEALGRPADFDQKSDSIVRVEAHRLRKRLREYYEAEGAGHALWIEIPAGQYVPRFHRRAAAERVEPVPSNGHPAVEPEPLEPLPMPVPEAVPALPAPGRPHRWLWVLAVALAVVVAAGAYAMMRRDRAHSLASASNLASATSAPETIRILCGREGGNYTDQLGNIWGMDQYFQGGEAFDSGNHPIRGTRDPRLYDTRREGSFGYNIPLKPGVYELRLHFAETVYGETNAAGGGESSRVFNLYINGKETLHQFDIISDAGPSTADIRVFKDISPAADGMLRLRFETHSNPAILSAIEITPGIPGKMRPIRMVSQDHAYADKSGRYWEPDRYARGGQLVIRGEPLSGTNDPDLYRGERFGNLTYVIPVADGRYAVTLHFAETWFGPGLAGSGGAGSRIFDILLNGAAVKRDFDIFKEAGGPDRAFVYTIHNVVPNHQGKIVLSLLPVKNYACVDALEVVDESE